MESLRKRRIARDQIVDAVAMFKQERYISATTLAGAADEIIGDFLKKKGLRGSRSTPTFHVIPKRHYERR
jgi:hypothetical protein